MATTGVPNQLYQGTDAPDLVDGAFATHTHEVEIEALSNISSDSYYTAFEIAHSGPPAIAILVFRREVGTAIQNGQAISYSFTVEDILTSYNAIGFDGVAIFECKYPDNTSEIKVATVNVTRQGNTLTITLSNGTNTGGEDIEIRNFNMSGILIAVA